MAGIAKELKLSDDQMAASTMFGKDLKRAKCENDFESEYTAPQSERGLPISQEKTLAALDDKIRGIKRQIKLVRNGTHPDLVTGLGRAEERCRSKRRWQRNHAHPAGVV